MSGAAAAGVGVALVSDTLNRCFPGQEPHSGEMPVLAVRHSDTAMPRTIAPLQTRNLAI
ncbi:MAG: hypothetical protein LBJ41_10090 [Treponema sp.]|nr:hypothetical protein [Treponema sp.]